MLEKLKSLFKGKETKAEERKEKANTTPQQYARAERTEPKKPVATSAKKPANAPRAPAPKRPVQAAKKPVGKPAQKRGK